MNMIWVCLVVFIVALIVFLAYKDKPSETDQQIVKYAILSMKTAAGVAAGILLGLIILGLISLTLISL